MGLFCGGVDVKYISMTVERATSDSLVVITATVTRYTTSVAEQCEADKTNMNETQDSYFSFSSLNEKTG